MKRFVAVLAGLLVLPAFAEVAPLYYDEIIEYISEDENAAENVDSVPEKDAEATVVMPVVQPSKVNPRSTSSSGRVATRGGNTVSSRNTTRRTATRTSAPATARGTTTRQAVARSASTPTRTSVAARASTNNGTRQISATRRTMQANTPVAARASIIQTDTVNKPLYSGNRLSTRSSSVRARIPTISSLGSNKASISSDTNTTITDMDELAQATDFCKAQYIQCMDQFCNVLDEAQGRCSCSKNIKNYEQTEQALKTAAEDLQDIAQQIQYIGLTADQVTSLFTQTEAELALGSTSDNSKINTSLNKIKDMIVDVKTPAPTSTATSSGFNFDNTGLLDFSFDSSTIDLSSMFGNTTNTASINNQRGEQLYKTATTRCKTAVLQNCQAQGVDISVITNAYDLEIDKQCVAYERELKDANDEMTMTVRNAKSVLQRARLVVAQQKNAYNLRECVTELDNCMQDDFVCGEDYENCLDPTGKYIVNGTVVLGSTPGVPGYTPVAESNKNLYETWIYTEEKDSGNVMTNAWGEGNIVKYVNARMAATKNVDKMADYLVDKIGTIDTEHDNKPLGMCAAILNQCQDYTYTGTGNNREYDPQNQVIKSFLERTLIQIKSAQDKVLADYAEDCVADVAECLSENNYTYSSGYYTTSNNPSNVAINACQSIIRTCQSVTGFDTSNSDTQQWLDKALGYTLTEIGQCTSTGGQWKTNAGTNDGYCDCAAEGLADGTVSNGRVLTCKVASK